MELSQYAFQYTLSEESKQKRKDNFHLHDVWGEFEGDELNSKLHLYPLAVFIGGNEFKMGGVAGVATWPEYRRGGSVARLIHHALKTMKDQGQMISLLHPFDIHFYRRFGWELCFSQKKYTIEKANLQFMPDAGGMIKRLTVKNDLHTINDIYEGFAKKYNGMLKRDKYWWENHVFSAGFHFAVYYNEEQKAKGYLFYKVADMLLDVQEFIYLDGEARRGLWNFICQHDSMVDKVKIVAPEDDQLSYLMQNPKNKIEVNPYFMARIVDVESFLKQYLFNKRTENLVLHVKDDKAEWNNQSFMIQNGVSKIHTPEADGITLSIRSLTAMLLGAQTPTFLHEADLIKGPTDQVNLLEDLIPKRKSCILDFF